jgi:hypothetical protein
MLEMRALAENSLGGRNTGSADALAFDGFDPFDAFDGLLLMVVK